MSKSTESSSLTLSCLRLPKISPFTITPLFPTQTKSHVGKTRASARNLIFVRLHDACAKIILRATLVPLDFGASGVEPPVLWARTPEIPVSIPQFQPPVHLPKLGAEAGPGPERRLRAESGRSGPGP